MDRQQYQAPQDSFSQDLTLLRLATLIDLLGVLVEQATTYEYILPPDNFPARRVAATLGDLARRILTEAQDLGTTLSTPQSTINTPFSNREQQVLTLAAQGLTNKEIAYRLDISDRTVQFHMNSVFNKTGTSSRTEAALIALRQGWIDIER